MKTKIFIGTLIIIVITYIGLTEMDMRPKLNLIKDAETINANIKKAKMPKTTEQILIKNGYKLNDTDYKIKGEGVIFLEEQYSFFIERKGMCAMKLPYSDKVMFQKAKCPEYRLINGLKMPILTSGQGVHEKDGVYTFKGNSVGNYVRYEHDFYRILSINKDMITLVKTEKENIEFETVEELYRKINDKYSIPNTIETEYNIDAVELSKNTINIINKKTIKAKVGVLTLNQYLETFSEEVYVEGSEIKLNSSSYIKGIKSFSNPGVFINNNEIFNSKINGNVYLVINIPSSFVVSNGEGSKAIPYEFRNSK